MKTKVLATLGPSSNSSAISNALALRIDTQASAAPDAPDLSSLYDTGESSTDNITSATILSFTLTGLSLIGECL